MEHLIFTYGTLMKGQRAHEIFGRMKFFADGILRDYGIYETGTYPAAVPVDGFSVYGEIYEVDDEVLHKLDEYESEGFLYKRRLLQIEVDPKIFDAWVYEYLQSTDNLELRAPAGKWTDIRKPIDDYAWYVCYGSNLLKERFDDYLERTDARVYAQKSHMLNGQIYFAKNSPTWDNQGVCFLDLNKNECSSYGWAYLVDRDRIDAISEEEGESWYPVQSLGKDEYGIALFTVTSSERYPDNKACLDYLSVIAAGLQDRFNLTQNQIRRYLDCNDILDTGKDNIDRIISKIVNKH